ncbi:cell envelope integrity protein TolA [Fluviispira sanaruensis]|uniref:Outer membrane protein beta-barrel domain-containing protein n=1 Tax=Fluviispira sanaruensis TaxID=2493639 RepID=A0A4P2VSA7_FLUSA|nr:cell envelope integrity protein TolA [Fluviispira sanaruensis]BBH52155.1 hypothetical protein JCM31447_05950 [Fluviispira sanaruensis]
MRKLLETVIIIFLLCFFSKVSAQEDPTVPISQRYLNNPLINDATRNPIPSNNPFIQSQGSQKTNNKNLKPNETLNPQKKIETETKNQTVEEAKKNEQQPDKKEEKKSEIAEKKEESKPDVDNGLFGPFRIGPMVGFGLFMGPNFSIESKIFKYIGLSISYSGFNSINLFYISQIKSLLNNQSSSFTINALKMKYNQLEGKLSIFPFGTSFFLGVAYGQRNISLNANADVIVNISGLSASTPVKELIEITTIYLTPQIGWLATWGGRYGWFAVGTEFGLQFPVKNTVTLTTTFTDPGVTSSIDTIKASSEYIALSNQLQSSLVDNLNKYPIPYWNILKIGWLF